MRKQAIGKVLLLCSLSASVAEKVEQCFRDDASLLQSRTAVQSADSVPVSKNLVPHHLILTGRFASVDELPAQVLKNVGMAQDSHGNRMALRYLNDTACRGYLKDNFGNDFAQIYDDETHGSFRGDICRSAVLLREGGFYMDLDFQLHVPILSLIDENTTLMSIWSSSQGATPVVLNALIAARPNSTVMQKTMRKIKSWYSGPREGLLGPSAMAEAMAEVMKESCPIAVEQQIGDNRPLQWECGSDNFRFYQEFSLGWGKDCLSAGSVVCPDDRAVSKFAGTEFAVISPGITPMEKRLIGWPRFAACDKNGCGLNGGSASL